MNPIKKLAGQTAIYGLGSVVGRLFNYLLVPLYTRVFSTEQYGVITEMYAFVAFLVILLTYGMETALFRFSSTAEDKKKVFGTSLISVLTTSSFFIILCIIFSEPIAQWLRYPNNKEYVIWFAIIVGLDALCAIPFAKLREKNKATLFASINLTNIGVNIGLNLFFLVYCRNAYQMHGEQAGWLVQKFYNPETGVGYVFISNLVATVVKTMLLTPYMITKGATFNIPLLKKMMLYGSPLLLAGVAGIVNEAIDRIMLKRILIDTLGEKATLEQLGIYGACYKISIIISIFIQAFRYAAEPFFFAQGQNEKARKIYITTMNYFVIICSAIFLGIMMYIDIVMLFIGEAFREGAHIVPVLLMANLCLGIYFNLSIWYKLTGKTIYGAYIAIFGAAVTIILNLYWIPKIGYTGSARATLICYASMMLISYFLGQKHYPVNYNVKKILGYPFLAVIIYTLSDIIIIPEYMRMSANTLFLVIFIAIAVFTEGLIFKKKTNIL